MSTPSRRSLLGLAVACCVLAVACSGSAETQSDAARDAEREQAAAEARAAATPAAGEVGNLTPAPAAEPDRSLLEIALMGRELADLTAEDPAFFGTEGCAEVRALYRYIKTTSVNGEPVQELDPITADLQLRADYLRAIAGYSGFRSLQELEQAALVLDAYRTRLTATWGVDGSDLDAAVERSRSNRFRFLMSEPVTNGDTVITQDSTDAGILIWMAVDRAVLRCAAPPSGWTEPAIDPDLVLPELGIIALPPTGTWTILDLGTGTRAEAPFPRLKSLSLDPNNERFIATSIMGELLMLDPRDWSSDLVADGGSGWSCASFTTESSAIASTSFTGDVERSRVFPLDGVTNPVELPADVGACPYSIGDGELVYTDDDGALMAVTLDDERRELLRRDECLYVAIAPARDGVLDVYANCANPFQDGLYLLDLQSGEASHHIGGLVGAGHLSADGQWRIFGFVPADLESPRVPELWIRHEPTGSFALVSDEGLVFPQFLPAPAE